MAQNHEKLEQAFDEARAEYRQAVVILDRTPHKPYQAWVKVKTTSDAAYTKMVRAREAFLAAVGAGVKGQP